MDARSFVWAALEEVLAAACVPLHIIALLLELAHTLLCTRRRPPPRSILITGAGGGLGRALALHYARHGAQAFCLLDVQAAELEATAASVRTIGASATCRIVDITDAVAVSSALMSADAAAPLDLVLAVAGIIETRVGGGRGLDDVSLGARAVTAVNVLGTMNTVLSAVDVMRPRGRGQIGVVSSLAGEQSFCSIYPAYAASKAWATTWALSLRAHLWDSGIRINVLAPGALSTPLLVPPSGLDTHYDLAATAPWAAHSYAIELPAEYAARAWADDLSRDEAVTRPSRFYGTAVSLCIRCPRDTHDGVRRCGLFPLWSWKPRRVPAHAWTATSAVAATDGVLNTPRSKLLDR